MLAIALLVASADVKTAWLNSDTHPVYNSRIKPIPMPMFARIAPEKDESLSLAASIEKMLGGKKDRSEIETTYSEEEKDRAVERCANYRYWIDRFNAMILDEATSPMPDAESVAGIQRIRSDFQKSMEHYAPILKKHPELEQLIQSRQRELKEEE